MHDASIKPYLSSFGRNRGRSLRPYQQGLVDALLPRLAVDISELRNIVAGGDDRSIATPLGGSPIASFGDWVGGKSVVTLHPPHRNAEIAFRLPPKGGVSEQVASSQRHFTRVALEIGFGGGEHLLAQATHNPDTLFIGCEPFINGVAKCLAGIDSQKLANIRLFTDDARKLIEQLPDASVDSVFILFPDPWPKARHNKRRLVNAETLAMLARVHKPGGRLLLATDHVDYSVWMLQVLQHSPDYAWTAQKQADWKNPPSDWTETKYQRKTSAEGREPVFLECVRH
jgi:tRNA (guanine-N7-)-methyltransferase